MKFYGKLYVGDSVGDPDKVKWKLRRGSGWLSVYLITLAASSDQLDIFHCALLRQKWFDTENLFVIGIASGYEEAVELVTGLMRRAVEKTGEADIKAYILDTIRQGECEWE